MTETLTVTCPHCRARLEIDAEAGVVTSHEVPETPTDSAGFEERLRRLEAEKARASDRMAEAMRRERSKDRLMEDRFNKLLDKAKHTPDDDPGPRDIDLD